MKIASLNVDDKGESYFGDVECAQEPGSNREREIPGAHWQIWVTQPGHFADFKPVDAPKSLAVLSGKLEITASTGEKRYFSRGDTFLLQDISGKGHAVRSLGIDECQVLMVTMKEIMTENAQRA